MQQEQLNQKDYFYIQIISIKFYNNIVGYSIINNPAFS